MSEYNRGQGWTDRQSVRQFAFAMVEQQLVELSTTATMTAGDEWKKEIIFFFAEHWPTNRNELLCTQVILLQPSRRQSARHSLSATATTHGERFPFYFPF